jgi:hypothetical protein
MPQDALPTPTPPVALAYETPPDTRGRAWAVLSLAAACAQWPFMAVVYLMLIEETWGQPVRFGRETTYCAIAIAPALVAVAAAACAVRRGVRGRARGFAVAGFVTGLLAIAGGVAGWWGEVLFAPPGAVRDAL